MKGLEEEGSFFINYDKIVSNTTHGEKIGKKRIVAFGKASLAMASALATIVDIDEGIVIIPHGQGGERPPGMDIIEEMGIL